MAFNPPKDEMKELIRAIEDKREARIQLQISNTILRNDVAAYKELAENEVKRNTHLKELLEKLREYNEQERLQFETISSVRGTLKNGVMLNITTFADSYVQQFKESVEQKKEQMEKKLQQEIDEFTKSNPLFVEYTAKQTKLAELQRYKDKLVEEEKVFRQKMDRDKQVRDVLLQQNIVEFAQHYQRYNEILDKIRNPNKKAEKRPSLMWQWRMLKPSVSSSSQPLPLQCSQNDEMMSEPSVTSNSQEAIRMDEVTEGQSVNRGSISRGEKNQRNEVVNNESPKQATISKRQSANKKNQNVRNGKEKQGGALEQSQQVVRSGSSLKAATEVSSKKNQQPKIVLPSGSSLKAAPDASTRIKQQSKQPVTASSMSYKSTTEVSGFSQKKQQPPKNVMPSGSCLKAAPEPSSQKKQQPKIVLPSGNALKAAPEVSSQKSQPSKKGKVTFVDYESSVSGVDSSKDDENMSSELDLSAENDMDIENDIPINDDFDDNVQMDDDENSDEHHGENINENNDDNDLCQEFDGNLSEITNWTSLGVPTENHSNENSPPHFDFDADFGSGGLFQENDHNDKPFEAGDNFNFGGMDDDMGDMDDLFK